MRIIIVPIAEVVLRVKRVKDVKYLEQDDNNHPHSISALGSASYIEKCLANEVNVLFLLYLYLSSNLIIVSGAAKPGGGGMEVRPKGNFQAGGGMGDLQRVTGSNPCSSFLGPRAGG